MKITKLLILIIFSLWGLGGFAQEELSKEEKERRERNIQAGNPFAKFGYKAKVATLSKGKYLEVHDLDSIVTIGTTRWHVDKNKIVGDIVIDSLNPDARPIGDVAGRWISPDPLSEEFPSWSPYNMSFNNPLKFVDPDGRAPVIADHIIVEKNKDGTYKVVGGEANSDRGIYLNDGKGGKGEQVGNMKTTHSFFDDKDRVVSGAILNPNSTAGQDFVNDVMSENPGILTYMANATGGGEYDFKVEGIENKPKGQTDIQYKYRGSVDENGDFGSARDFGNFTAGMVAARAGYSWSSARAAFDTLETIQNSEVIPVAGKPVPIIRPTREATTTVKAQMTGFLIGLQRYQKQKTD